MNSSKITGEKSFNSGHTRLKLATWLCIVMFLIPRLFYHTRKTGDKSNRIAARIDIRNRLKKGTIRGGNTQLCQEDTAKREIDERDIENFFSEAVKHVEIQKGKKLKWLEVLKQRYRPEHPQGWSKGSMGDMDGVEQHPQAKEIGISHQKNIEVVDSASQLAIMSVRERNTKMCQLDLLCINEMVKIDNVTIDPGYDSLFPNPRYVEIFYKTLVDGLSEFEDLCMEDMEIFYKTLVDGLSEFEDLCMEDKEIFYYGYSYGGAPRVHLRTSM